MKIMSFTTALVAILILGPVSSFKPCYGRNITFQWDRNNEPDLAGYKIYYKTGASGPPYDGTGADQGDSPFDVGNVTTLTIQGLSGDVTYFFVATAYDTEGLESDYSNEVSATVTEGRSVGSVSSSGDGGCAMSNAEGNIKGLWAAALLCIGWILRKSLRVRSLFGSY